MGIKLIASDLDGTIMNEFNTIAGENLSAFQKIQDKEIRFAISTGKPYALIKDVCHTCPASYGIFGNGMQIMDLKNNKEIYSQSLSKNAIRICLSIAKKHHLHVHFYTNQKIVSEKLAYMDLRNYLLNKDKVDGMQTEIVPDIETYLETLEEPICKFVITGQTDLTSVKNEILELLDVTILGIKKYHQYRDTIIDKEYEYLDIAPKGASKGKALSILQDYLQIKKEDTLAVGDNMNDIDMLQNAGTGVAVANAFDEVKDVASYVTTKSVNEGGFAEAIRKYLV